ncbi:hypothetical protein E4O98_11955 [Pseudomonas sp. W2Jun17]|uniref:DUF6429 domain-containing protein n=1 Tax=Pseudomonas synxantha TaxID=47883 RepID=A0A5D3G6T0_9PSED|nr:hypothetical protein [Pseudomonas sp. W2Jun17]TYK56189.1 hypothetical protein FXO26_20830 [Pseudomonas synxantha]
MTDPPLSRASPPPTGDLRLTDRHGYILNPVNKNKSIWLTTQGLERGRQLADRLFGTKAQVKDNLYRTSTSVTPPLSILSSLPASSTQPTLR